ncbi:hypothetical protein BDZ85DRAFT_110257 [Elsinoe ampelina]|uniref:Uncharacterized protein n=1 Tax=Elsinoe ampelina TaxID=302913 RepID=A0A6A6GDL3_9PEZI|nr:hypothetical protein BDZ85DRAFT_110257 [Elsinoe ampelina]
MTTHLRRTFHYPSDTDPDPTTRHPDDELDNDQQEAIITSLRTQNENSIRLYRTIFAALPTIIALSYLPSLVVPAKRRDALTALLAISNLLCSAYTIYFLPVHKGEAPTGVGGRRQRALLAEMETPVALYLPVLNAGLAGALALFGTVLWRKGDVVGGLWGVVPAAVYAVVMVARRELVPLDIEGLEKMRYEYKGA